MELKSPTAEIIVVGDVMIVGKLKLHMHESFHIVRLFHLNKIHLHVNIFILGAWCQTIENCIPFNNYGLIFRGHAAVGRLN
jgi:hypothetical protein